MKISRMICSWRRESTKISALWGCHRACWIVIRCAKSVDISSLFRLHSISARQFVYKSSLCLFVIFYFGAKLCHRGQTKITHVVTITRYQPRFLNKYAEIQHCCIPKLKHTCVSTECTIAPQMAKLIRFKQQYEKSRAFYAQKSFLIKINFFVNSSVCVVYTRMIFLLRHAHKGSLP